MKKHIAILTALASTLILTSANAEYGVTTGGHIHREFHKQTIEKQTFKTEEKSSTSSSSSKFKVKGITEPVDKDDLLIDVREKSELAEYKNTKVDNDTTFYENGILAKVRKEKLWGIFGTDETITLKPEYKKLTAEKGGFFLAQNSKKDEKYIDKNGKEISNEEAKKILRREKGILGYKEGNLYGFKNGDGKVIISPRYKKVLTKFSEGIAFVIDENGSNIAIDENGTKLFNNKYKDIESYKYGVAEYHRKVNAVKARTWLGVLITSALNDIPEDDLVDRNTYKEVKRGFIDKSGNIVIDSKNDKVYPMTKYGTFVINKGETKFVNTHGNTIFRGKNLKVDSISTDDGYAVLKDKEFDTVGILDMKSGNFTTGSDYDKIILLGQNRAIAKWEGTRAYIDASTGEEILTLSENVHIKQFGNTPYTWICKRGEFFAIIDTKGNIIHKEKEIENAKIFKNGYAPAKKNGKWGIINTEGIWVLSPNYDEIEMM